MGNGTNRVDGNQRPNYQTPESKSLPSNQIIDTTAGNVTKTTALHFSNKGDRPSAVKIRTARRDTIPPSHHEEKQEKAVLNIKKNFFRSFRERLSKIGITVRGWFTRSSGKEEVSKASLKGTSPLTEDKPLTEDEIVKALGDNLSPEEKQQRIDNFVEIFTHFLNGPKDEDKQGIFRISGLKDKKLELAEGLLGPQYKNLCKGQAIPDLASAFKLFIKACNIFSDPSVQECLSKFSTSDDREAILKEAIGKMPEDKKKLLKSLLPLLNLISAGKLEETKMDPKNLAICIGPNFVSGKKKIWLKNLQKLELILNVQRC